MLEICHRLLLSQYYCICDKAKGFVLWFFQHTIEISISKYHLTFIFMKSKSVILSLILFYDSIPIILVLCLNLKSGLLFSKHIWCTCAKGTFNLWIVCSNHKATFWKKHILIVWKWHVNEFERNLCVSLELTK